MDGFLEQVHLSSAGVDGQPGSNGISLYAYNIIKAASNGFLLASSVAASSSDAYLDNGLHLESAEILSKGLSQSAILHSFVDPESNEASWTVDLLNAGRMAESIAHGAAMGSQLAMVQPRSMEFGDNYEVFTNSRREIAKSVSRKGNGQLMGRTSCFRKVNFMGDDSLIGKLRSIKITEATHSSLSGDLN